MKFNYKKISAIVASTIMAGMTFGFAAAAAYPAPFISGGTANVAIVYGTGTGVSTLDLVNAGYIQSNLQSKMGTSSGGDETVAGEAKSLNSGSNLLYLLDKLSENVATITKNDLPTVLADGKFVDDAGTTWEFEQTITVGTSTTNRFSFGNSDNDFDDPALMLELATSTSSPMYTWTLSWDKATNLTATDSEGQEITLFGKTYTVGTSSDSDTLILLGGSGAETVYVGETVPILVEGVTYQVTLDGLSSAATTVASITINGETKTMTEGQTKTYVVDGKEIDVYAKTVFRTGDSGEGHVEVELGADKLTFETTNAVQYGSDNTDIEGTLVTITGGVNAMTKMTIAVAAADSDENHVLVGESFTDPVFKTLKLEFNSVSEGPTFTGEADTGRTLVELDTGGNRELQVVLTDKSGTVKTVPFTYNAVLQDDASNPFVVVEGNNLTDDDYFILNSGDYQHLMVVSKVNLASITTSDIEIEDVFTGTKYLLENKDFTHGQNVTINSQTYVLTNTTSEDTSAGGFKIESADAYATTHRDVFPYIELVAGQDFPRLAFVNTSNKINDDTGDVVTAVANGTAVNGRIYNLPTGTIQFRLTDNCVVNAVTCAVNTSTVEYSSTATDGTAGTWTATGIGENITSGATVYGNYTTLKVGEGAYTFGFTHGNPITGAFVTLDNVTVDDTFTASTTSATALDSIITKPVLMFIEDKDKSDADARNVILINTTDDGTYSELNNFAFSGASQYDSETWDNNKLVGYLTDYGTYALKDTTDTNIALGSLSYGDAQMYANVYLAEASASITTGGTGGTGTLGDVLVKDSEVGNVATKNLIVVGGSCINSAAATLVGGTKCGAAWTTATGVGSGQFIIKGYATSSLTSKIALLVAGYEAADTANAATYLRTKAVDTSKAYKGTSATSAELIVE
jgi:hypothetical protein